MKRYSLLLASVSAAMLAPAIPVSAAPAAATQGEDAHARLTALFHESDEASLRRNPVNALFRGDLRYADRLGDFITDRFADDLSGPLMLWASPFITIRSTTTAFRRPIPIPNGPRPSRVFCLIAAE